MNVFSIQAPVESTGSKCPNCGAAIVADQRYCLTCGRPCSPVRLAFLDVLQAESELRQPVAMAPPAGYFSPSQDGGVVGRLRHYSPLFGLIAVLLMCGLIGLLIGHWLEPSKAPTTQVLKVEGGTLPVTAAPTTSTTTTIPSVPRAKAPASKQAATSHAREIKEVKEAETPKAKPKAPVRTSSATLKKLQGSTGKKHQREIEELTAGDKPIETGG